MGTKATIHAQAVLRLREQLEELGLPSQQLLEAVSLTGLALSGEERVSRENYLRAKALASLQLDDPCIGFWFGARTSLDELDLLGALISQAHTLNEAIELGARYLALWEEGTALTIQTNPANHRAQISYESVSPSAREQLIDAQHSLLLLVNATRALHPSALRDAVAHFACPRPRHTRCLQAVNSSNVALRFDAPSWFLEIDANALHEPLPKKNKAVRRVLHEAAGRVLETLNTEEDLVARMRTLLRSGRSFTWELRKIAHTLGTSTRTLQWHLNNAGSTFRREVQRARIDAACELLRTPSPTIVAIAERLGFNSAAAFTRFFRQETGVTPSQYRKKQQQTVA